MIVLFHDRSEHLPRVSSGPILVLYYTYFLLRRTRVILRGYTLNRNYGTSIYNVNSISNKHANRPFLPPLILPSHRVGSWSVGPGLHRVPGSDLTGGGEGAKTCDDWW